jgi:hypothetical protein
MRRIFFAAMSREPDLSVARAVLALLVLVALIFGDNIDRCAIGIGAAFAAAMAGGNGG